MADEQVARFACEVLFELPRRSRWALWALISLGFVAAAAAGWQQTLARGLLCTLAMGVLLAVVEGLQPEATGVKLWCAYDGAEVTLLEQRGGRAPRERLRCPRASLAAIGLLEVSDEAPPVLHFTGEGLSLTVRLPGAPHARPAQAAARLRELLALPALGP